MTPDTRTTENPEPRTEAGRRLLGLAGPDYQWPELLAADILAIEAEAAQGAAPRQHEMYHCWCREYHAPLAVPKASEGAAPRAEGLDVAAEVASEMRAFLHGAKMAPPVAPGWLRQIEKWYARLAPQERRP